MADRRYRIVESVGRELQYVHSYEDLEKHHPTWREDPTRRRYGEISGRREEYILSPSGERMVSKDFVLLSGGSANVSVPSPLDGYVRRSERLDRWGTIQIYDGPGADARLLAQIRHMDPIRVADGQHVRMGQPLGQQGRKAPSGVTVGLHTHMDIAEGHLEDFRAYIKALDSGAITSGRNQSDAIGGQERMAKSLDAASNSERGLEPLRIGGRGPEVRHLQQAMAALGYTGPSDAALMADGDFGRNTEHAVRAFQRAHGLLVDGVVGRDTWAALKQAEQRPLISERKHPGHPLFLQAVHGIRELPQGTFSNSAQEAQAAGVLAVQAKAAGITRIDHVLMNTRGDALMAVQGGLQDPARSHVAAGLSQSVTQSLERSTSLWAEAAHQHQSTQVSAQLQHLEHRGLSMGMRP